METKSFNHPREAKLYMDSLNLDSVIRKEFINPVENTRFFVDDYRIKEVEGKFYVVLSLTKLNASKDEPCNFEVDYETFKGLAPA